MTFHLLKCFGLSLAKSMATSAVTHAAVHTSIKAQIGGWVCFVRCQWHVGH